MYIFCFCIYILRGAVKFRVEQLFQENDIVLKSLNCNKNIESFFFLRFFLTKVVILTRTPAVYYIAVCHSLVIY